ncbi:MAG: YiiD C-terminal domain-containing protein [Pseudomonadota bacterium]
MLVTDLAINQAMGMRFTAPGATHILEMPESELLLNHLGSIHAGVQFSLAEACSGAFLQIQLTDWQDRVMAVLRSSEVKFRAPAHGCLRATAQFDKISGALLSAQLAARGRALAPVLIEVLDEHNVMTMHGRYLWFLQAHT